MSLSVQQVCDPIAGSLALSTLGAIIPIVVLFVLLAGIRVEAQWASLATLATALVIALLIYGLFPIVWIVIYAMFPKYKNTRVAI